MSTIVDAQEPPSIVDGESCNQDAAPYLHRVNLRALMDVVFGVAALALLLTWLVLAIAGRRLA